MISKARSLDLGDLMPVGMPLNEVYNLRVELGIFSFGELTTAVDNTAVSAEERVAQLVELGVLADQVGLDVVGLGEHHRPDFAVASPAVVLAAIAQATKRVRLTSTVTVLSTADPVRVFEDFAALDLVSGGRAELTAGRGAYVESFPLYGGAVEDYDALFDEKLDLLLAIREHEVLEWSGQFRPPLQGVGPWPRPAQPRLPVWVAVGGTPASLVRAGVRGLPVYLAILGNPAGFAPLADLYRASAAEAGVSPEQLRLGVSSHCYVAETSQQARNEFYEHYAAYFAQNMPGGRAGHLSREAFESWAGPDGALFCGSPDEVAEKILREHELLGHDRFLAQVGLGGLPQNLARRSVELLGERVAPAVRSALR